MVFKFIINLGNLASGSLVPVSSSVGSASVPLMTTSFAASSGTGSFFPGSTVSGSAFSFVVSSASRISASCADSGSAVLGSVGG